MNKAFGRWCLFIYVASLNCIWNVIWNLFGTAKIGWWFVVSASASMRPRSWKAWTFKLQLFWSSQTSTRSVWIDCRHNINRLAQIDTKLLWTSMGLVQTESHTDSTKTIYRNSLFISLLSQVKCLMIVSFEYGTWCYKKLQMILHTCSQWEMNTETTSILKFGGISI